MNKLIPSYRGVVDAWECDQMGHLNVQFYMSRASEAFGHLQNAIGLNPARIREEKKDFRLKTLRIQYKSELHPGSIVHGVSGIRRIDGNILTGFTHLWDTAFDKLSAIYEFTAQFTDLVSDEAAPCPNDIFDAAAAMADPHSDLYTAAPMKSVLMARRHMDHMFDSSRTAVDVWECDAFDHIEMRHIVGRFSDAATHAMTAVGLSREAVRTRNLGSAALDYYAEFHSPIRRSRPIVLRSGILEAAGKIFTFGHNLIDLDTGEIAVTATVLGCYFDMSTRKSVPLPEEYQNYPREKHLKAQIETG